MLLTGRTVVYTDADEINDGNVIEVLTDALNTHRANREQIDYLYNYYKGKQPILTRTKAIRSEICHRTVENRASEIVSFKVGYLMGEPIQYVNRGNDDGSSEAINILNEYVFAEDKAAKDKALADWFTICGTAYRMILPDKYASPERGDEAPFEIYTLDPRDTFVVYHSGLGHAPMMGVTYVTRADGQTVYSVYTRDTYYEITGDLLCSVSGISSEAHLLGDIPIIEYPANSARLGAFEIVLPLLDAMNEVVSNRLDGVEQFIQSLLVLKGVDLESDDFKKIRENLGLLLPADGDAEYLTQELNQTQTQALVDYMYQTVLTICGMPNRNGGSSTSDTGSAVIMRDGWSAAEARAKDSELMFKLSEKRFLKLAINIAECLRGLKLRRSAIEIRFTRRNYENIQEKAQVLISLLSNERIHPRLAFEHCGLFVDPELAYTSSCDYYETAKREAEREFEAAADAAAQSARTAAEGDGNV